MIRPVRRLEHRGDTGPLGASLWNALGAPEVLWYSLRQAQLLNADLSSFLPRGRVLLTISLQLVKRVAIKQSLTYCQSKDPLRYRFQRTDLWMAPGWKQGTGLSLVVWSWGDHPLSTFPKLSQASITQGFR